MTPAVIIRDEETRQRAIERIKALNLDAPKPWGVFVDAWEKIKTREQEKLYWAVVDKIKDATGHSRNVIHTLLRKEAWGVEVAEVRGEKIEAVRSSAGNIARPDYSNLIEEAHQLASELGVPI